MPAFKECSFRILRLLAAIGLLLTSSAPLHAAEPAPTQADVSYGEGPRRVLDLYIPAGDGPFPVVVWYGGIWKPAKHPARPDYFNQRGIAVVAVQTRTLTDGMEDKAAAPISYVADDACRAVQFIRLNAAKWKLDPDRIAVGGGSQGSLPALYVGCSADRADPKSEDSVERVSTSVRAVAAYRSQPTIDPRRMQEWVPGVEWGAPSLGCSFKESLARREELLPVIQKWSPDHLLHRGAAPIYFENEWGLVQPENVTKSNYDTHCPAWGLGFQKLAHAQNVECHVKYQSGPPTGDYADTWDFLVQKLKAPKP